METEGFAIYDAMMQLKNEVRFCVMIWLLIAHACSGCFFWLY